MFLWLLWKFYNSWFWHYAMLHVSRWSIPINNFSKHTLGLVQNSHRKKSIEQTRSKPADNSRDSLALSFGILWELIANMRKGLEPLCVCSWILWKVLKRCFVFFYLAVFTNSSETDVRLLLVCPLVVLEPMWVSSWTSCDSFGT